MFKAASFKPTAFKPEAWNIENGEVVVPRRKGADSGRRRELLAKERESAQLISILEDDREVVKMVQHLVERNRLWV